MSDHNGAAGGDGRDPSTPYILIVDDQEDNRILMQELLEWKGYRVVLASTGEAGLKNAREERPALVLMDMTMPGMDGYEATRQMRLLPGCEDVPIFAMTAYRRVDAGDRCIEAGCTGFLGKPFEMDRLVDLVRQYVGPGRA